MKLKKRYLAGAAAAVITASAVPVLIGGRVAKDGDYPAIVRITSNSGAGCTAAVVGPNVVLTAAHCVNSGGTVRFKHSGKSYRSDACVHHDGYKENKTKDFALCKVSQSVAKPWVSINTDHKFVSVGDSILLTGYGCIKKGGGGADGLLRVGEAKVIRTPSNNSFDIVTRSGSALCFGDSGGPAFKGGKLVAVNSRGNIDDTSYVSAVHLADQSFMKPWADNNGVSICGLSSCDKPDEKQPEPEPGPDSSPSWWATLLWWLLDLFVK